MSSFFTTEAKNNDLVACPFDAAHQIRKARMAYHIVKCQKQHPDVTLECCPFDSSHRIKPEDMVNHKKTCDGRARMEEYSRIFHEDVAELGASKRNIEVVPVVYDNEDDEFWDHEVGTKSYNPQEAIKDRQIIRLVRGMTKSERKDFYAKEHQRHVQLVNHGIVGRNSDDPNE